MIEIYDKNNKKLECEILFTFKDNSKQFIVYIDKEEDILSSYYEREDDKLIIRPIISDEDYDIVDKYLEEWWKQND